MSLLPSLARSLRSTTPRLARFASSKPADDLIQAALADAEATPAASSSATAGPSNLSQASSLSKQEAASLFAPSDFYAQAKPSTQTDAASSDIPPWANAKVSSPASPASSSSSSSSRRSAKLHDPDYFKDATVPYHQNSLPQSTDPLCDFWVNLTMTHGNKLKATIYLSRILDAIYRQTNSPPLPIFREAISTASPMCRLKSIRKGAKTLVVPIPLSERQRTRFGIQWILKAADKRAAKEYEKRVAMECLAVLDGSSNVLKMLDERHKVAMMNRSNLPRNMGA